MKRRQIDDETGIFLLNYLKEERDALLTLVGSLTSKTLDSTTAYADDSILGQDAPPTIQP